VSLQYSSGVHKIASWSHLTNAHPLPGPGIIAGLAKVGQPLGRALILLAEMSSKGSLATGGYTDSAVEMARDAGKEFVVGFIAQSRVEDRVPASPVTDKSEASSVDAVEDFLILSPGVGLAAKGDAMGQQYRTPREVIFESGCDIIIVGRGIYGIQGGDEAVKAEAERYREAGWQSYLERTRQA
jgi:orotidine-5'-phosphate decarboxylase